MEKEKQFQVIPNWDKEKSVRKYKQGHLQVPSNTELCFTKHFYQIVQNYIDFSIK